MDHPAGPSVENGHVDREAAAARRARVLVVELEPAPYKIDLWNAVTDSGLFDVRVIYTTDRDWAPDGSHLFGEAPVSKFDSTVFAGRKPMAKLGGVAKVAGALSAFQPHVVVLSGYVHVLPLATLLLCALARVPYLLHNDVFNVGRPAPVLGEGNQIVAEVARHLIRRLVFSTSRAVLACGRRGVDSAVEAGCARAKAFDFPYVVSGDRIRADVPSAVPDACRADVAAGRLVVLFSGRMIPRKGLSVLLEACASLADIPGWVLWVEGTGPQAEDYAREAAAQGLAERVRFLGFGQMALHSWLVRHAGIVVVPSIHDSWGIVVDEGMQLGKAVITTDATGSGVDRVETGHNGLMVRAGDVPGLARALRRLMTEPGFRATLAANGAATAARHGPRRNAATLAGICTEDWATQREI